MTTALQKRGKFDETEDLADHFENFNIDELGNSIQKSPEKNNRLLDL
jgi:hypothetical protein